MCFDADARPPDLPADLVRGMAGGAKAELLEGQMAVARLLFERGWTHADAASWCDHLDDFRALSHRKTVAAWCADAVLDRASVGFFAVPLCN